MLGSPVRVSSCTVHHPKQPGPYLVSFLTGAGWQEKLSTTTGKCWGCFFSFLSTADECMISFCPKRSKGIPKVWDTGNRPSERARS